MQIKVLGITLTDMGLREMLRKTDVLLNNGALNTIAYVSTQKLVEASEQEEEKRCIEELDMTVCEDTEVLKAAGITSKSRIREVEQEEYLIEFLRKVKHNHYSTFLFADTPQELNSLEEDLRTVMSALPIRGRATLSEYNGNKESIINAMNVVAPMVILSRFPFPQELELMQEYRMQVNAEVWLTLPQHFGKKRKSFFVNFKEKLIHRKFAKKVIHFQDGEDNQNNQ